MNEGVKARVTRTHEPENLAMDVRPIAPADVRNLRIDQRRGLDADDVLALIVQHPGLSFWHPESGEFIVVTPWRHRLELPYIHTISAIRHETELIHAATEAAARTTAAALIYVDSYEIRRPAFYVTHGFQRIEEIVTFELSRPHIDSYDLSRFSQQFIQVPIRDEAWIQTVVEVDHRAFPWVWWNSREEFATYLQYPGVEVWAGVVDDEVVSYVGFTHYFGWGHLDRIATRPDWQGKGLGREALDFAIERVIAHGGKRVVLSTQGDNARSQRLYLRKGFKSTPQHDYAVYGVIFDPERVPVMQR